ncbi:MAG: hypothetical protein HKM93_06965 [Desulfobacteraceae bacterium]|nr:hypothetical protein [Desulfobacteraceae bacterium]
MLFARGKNRWTNLRSFFININKLFLFLKQEDFTGYVHILLPNRQGLVLFQEGDVVNGLIEEGENRTSGQSTVRQILGYAEKYNDCRIFVAEFPPETVSVLSEIFSMRVRMVHERLSNEFTNLGKYVGRLNAARFTGYLDVRFPNDRRKGVEVILFRNGRITAIVAAHLQIRMDNPDKEKMERIREYLTDVQHKSLRYSVFTLE